MPTGYTSFIEDGQIDNGKDFLLLCARAFGACVTMRDEPLSKPIPNEMKVDDYYITSLEKALQRQAKYENMTIEEAVAQCTQEFERRNQDYIQRQQKRQTMKERYQQVLEEVKTWEPPTPEHENLKKFAIEQIEICLPDCDYSYDPPKKVEPEVWLAEKIKDATSDVAYARKNLAEEKERISRRNKWLSDLRASLK